jgi:transcriptional regulator with XRE-family HTH domain
MPKAHPVQIELAKLGETQVAFASKVGVSPATLSHVLNGSATAWPALRRRVAEALGQPERALFPELETK